MSLSLFARTSRKWPEFIFSVYATRDSIHRLATEDGSEIYEVVSTGNSNLGIAVDSNRNIFVVATDERIRKYNNAGDLIWTSSQITSQVNGQGLSIATNPQGYIFVGDGTVLKRLEPDGSFSSGWSYESSRRIDAIACEANGAIWICGATASSYSGYVDKINADGTLAWRHTAVFEQGGDAADEAPNNFALDGDGNTYAGTGASLIKIDPDGNFLWAVVLGNSTLFSVEVDRHGYIYTINAGNELKKFAQSDGTLIAEFADISPDAGSYSITTSAEGGITVDGQGFVYSQVLDEASNVFIAQIDPSDMSIKWTQPNSSFADHFAADPGRYPAFV